MKTLPFVLGLLAAGAVGALTAVLAVRSPSGPAESAAAPAPEDPGIEDLERRVERLSRRVRVLEEIRRMRGAPEAATAAAPAAEDAAAAAPLPETIDKVVGDKVQEALAKSEAERRNAIGRRFVALAAEREKDLIARLAEKAGLTPYQQTEMAKLLARRREAMSGFFRSMFGSGSDQKPEEIAKIREKAATIREETETAIKDLLTPDQYEVYRKERASLRGPGRFLGGPMGPGGGESGR